jgi:hypothetical protein
MKHDVGGQGTMSDHKPESLLPRRDTENLSTSWSYPETVE